MSGPEIPRSKLERIVEKSLKSIENNPSDLTARVDMGVAHFHMGPEFYDEALNELSDAWAGGAFDERIFYYLGVLYENITVNEEAEKQYRRFLNHHPDDREILLRLARLLFRQGHWEQAVEQYSKLAEKTPKDSTSLVNLGLAYQARHKTESALKGKDRMTDAEISGFLNQGIARLEQAKTLSPDLSRGIHLALAEMYAASEEWEKSLQAAGNELLKYPGAADTAALALQAQALQKLNRNEELLNTYEKWAAADPKNRSLPGKISALKRKLKAK